MVDYIDGTVLAQMGNPDMRIPIAHALAYPKRFDSGAEPLNIFSIAHMDFQIPDFQRFPCLRLAYEAIQIGGIMPTILNAANEMAVDAFLCHKMRFTDIAIVIEKTMQAIPTDVANSLERILEADKEARVAAGAIIAKLSANT
jgi:1-deoxy-D-xylulose-5-phosphate reductoisomerase